MSVRLGWKADIAKAAQTLENDPVIKIVRTHTGLSFPEFEEGVRLRDLVDALARALGTSPRKPWGSPFEVLVGFEEYPSQFGLWWDGFTCEVGCSAACGINLDEVMERLLSSELFRAA